MGRLKRPPQKPAPKEALKPAEDLRTERVQLPVRVGSFFDLDKIATTKATLSLFENGAFVDASILAERMSRDDRINSAVETRINGLLGTDRVISPGGDDARAEALAEEVEQTFPRLCPQAELAQLLRWGLMTGVGVAEVVWNRGAEPWTPALKVWHPQFLYWNWGTLSYWITTGAGTEEVLPGTGKWVVYSPGGYFRGWMRGLIRALAIPWVIRSWTYRDWARYSEKHGLGITKAKVPSKADAADKKLFAASVRALGAEAVVTLPQPQEGPGFDLEIIEATAQTYDGFDKLIERCESSIAVTVLGQNLTTVVKGGSKAAAQIHNEIRLDYRRADATSLAECLVAQLFRPWAELNFGSADLAPSFRWETDPPADITEVATGAKMLGDAIASLHAAGVNVDGKRMAEEAGLPLLDGAPPPTAAPTGAEPKAPPEAAGETSDVAGLSALSRPTEPPHVAGQRYADGVVDEAKTRGVAAMRPSVERVLEAIDKAESFEALRAELPALLDALDPAALAELTKDATTLALLAGRHAVRREA